jgi:hypothetical protein
MTKRRLCHRNNECSSHERPDRPAHHTDDNHNDQPGDLAHQPNLADSLLIEVSLRGRLVIEARYHHR